MPPMPISFYPLVPFGITINMNVEKAIEVSQLSNIWLYPTMVPINCDLNNV